MNASTESGRELPETVTGSERDTASQDLVRLMASTETKARSRVVELPRQQSPAPSKRPQQPTDTANDRSRSSSLRRTRMLQRAMLATSALLTTVLLLPLLPAGPTGANDRWMDAMEQSSTGNLKAAMETLYAYERALPASATGRRALALQTMSEHAAVMGHATQATLLSAKAATVAGLQPAEAAETVLPASAAASTLGVAGGFQTAAQRRADEVARLRVASVVRSLPAVR